MKHFFGGVVFAAKVIALWALLQLSGAVLFVHLIVVLPISLAASLFSQRFAWTLRELSKDTSKVLARLCAALDVA